MHYCQLYWIWFQALLLMQSFISCVEIGLLLWYFTLTVGGIILANIWKEMKFKRWTARCRLLLRQWNQDRKALKMIFSNILPLDDRSINFHFMFTYWIMNNKLSASVSFEKISPFQLVIKTTTADSVWWTLDLYFKIIDYLNKTFSYTFCFHLNCHL